MKLNRNESIAVKLKDLRAKLNKTQQEVAAAIGVKVSAIGMYESGKRVPKDNIKIKLAQYFNVKVEEIFFTI